MRGARPGPSLGQPREGRGSTEGRWALGSRRGGWNGNGTCSKSMAGAMGCHGVPSFLFVVILFLCFSLIVLSVLSFFLYFTSSFFFSFLSFALSLSLSLSIFLFLSVLGVHASEDVIEESRRDSAAQTWASSSILSPTIKFLLQFPRHRPRSCLTDLESCWTVYWAYAGHCCRIMVC